MTDTIFLILVIISSFLIGTYVSSIFTSRVSKFRIKAPKRFNDTFLIIPGVEPIEAELQSIQERGKLLGSNTTVIRSQVSVNLFGTISHLVVFRFKGSSYLYEEKHYLFKPATTSTRMLLEHEIEKIHQGLVSSMS